MLLIRHNIQWNILLLLFKDCNEQKQVKDFSRKLVLILPKMGPAFVKFGQLLSTRADLIGDVAALEFVKLQDELEQEKFGNIKKMLQRQLNINIDDEFAYFDSSASASASVSQVHCALTHDNQKIALKILRPNIRKSFCKNLDLLERLAVFIDCNIKKAARLKLPQVVYTLRNITKTELNLRLEAASADAISKTKNNILYVPKIFWKYTTGEILAMEWIDGCAIKYLPPAIPQLIKESMIKQITYNFFNQVFINGFFHADLHQGNIFIKNSLLQQIETSDIKNISLQNSIVLLDFGIVGWLNIKNRNFILEILLGFLNRDYEKVASAHFEAGYVSTKESQKLFALACRSVGEEIIGRPVAEISISKLLGRLFSISADFNMETQLELLLLQKNLIALEGIAYSLSPNVNMWVILSQWLEENFTTTHRYRYKAYLAFNSMHGIKKNYQQLFHNVNEAASYIIEYKAKMKVKSSKRKSLTIAVVFSAIIILYVILI